MLRQSKSIPFGLLLLVLAISLRAQAQQPATMSLNDLLDRADKETQKYVETFKNLLSEESKTIDIYDKNGGVKKTTSIKSTFIVYQLTKDQDRVIEFRNVLSVDGKPLPDADRRAQDFFAKVVSSESSKKEIEQLAKESSRYDGDLVISGMTLFQSPVLSANLRPFFEFKLGATIIIDGTPVYEVSYRQTRETSLISVNNKNDDPGNRGFQYEVDSDVGKDLNARVRGTLWIDAATFQVRREHRELTVQPDGAGSPMPAIVNDFDFQPSDFGILTPKKITHIQSRVRSKGELPVKQIGVTMEYSNFSKPDVEVKSSEVKNP